jgi:phi13 family phage major tail protein
MPNRVNWGLAASAWGKITTDAQGHDVYGTPTMFLGNRQVNWDPAGDMVKVFADGTVIYTGRQNSGYTGSLELTNLDDDFAAWALSESVDEKNVQFEEQEPTVNRFYLLWEWVQDAKNTRHVMYNITASRPSMSATTAGDGDSKTAQYRTLNLTAIPREDGIVKASTRVDVDSTVYEGWFSSAYVPTGSAQQTVTFTVTGTDSVPLEGAMIVLSNGTTAVTNASGQAVIYLAAGTYDLMASADGYTTDTDSVTVSTAAVTKAISLTAA